MLPFHQCTEEDFDGFADPSPEAEGMLSRMTNGKSGLYCINWAEVGDEV